MNNNNNKRQRRQQQQQNTAQFGNAVAVVLQFINNIYNQMLHKYKWTNTQMVPATRFAYANSSKMQKYTLWTLCRGNVIAHDFSYIFILVCCFFLPRIYVAFFVRNFLWLVFRCFFLSICLFCVVVVVEIFFLFQFATIFFFKVYTTFAIFTYPFIVLDLG